MIKTPILIVGAGPTGLMLSAQLHRYGAAHRIIERKPAITELSKALGVQARTLEQYRQLGVVDQAIGQGFVSENVRFIVNGKIRARVPFGDIGAKLSPYPYLFILEQSKNEALLFDHITSRGGEVDWATEIADLHETNDGYGGRLLREDGSSEVFECEYLIGCDGASSFVRQFLEMPFPGATNEQLFFVADINMDINLEKQGLFLAINGEEFLAFFPMSGVDQYRAIGVLPTSIHDPDNIAFDQLKDHIETHIGMPVKITGSSWHSGYRVHHRIAESFRSGKIFLAGDAAHIHSPAGGQGMNTGLGDAVNLGWKIAAVVNGWSDRDILNSYNEERRPFGVQLVETTDRAFTMMVSKDRLSRLFRTHLFPLLLTTVLRFEPLRRLMFKTISQTRINYRKSGLSDGSRAAGLQSGDRFPWFEWDGGNSFEWLAPVGFVVLRLGGAPSIEIPNWQGPVKEIEVGGKAAEAAVKAGLPVTGTVIVRPDMHLAQLSLKTA